jgi:hypothetical protein
MIDRPMSAFLTLLLVSGVIRADAGQLHTGSFAFTCAAFPAELTEADLIARHGRENVIHALVFGSDDGPQDGTVLFPRSEDARLEIVWWNQEARTAPMWIKAVGSRWTTASGVTVGADLVTVERANGRPFRLAGFQTEAQGVVKSWGKGRLDQPAGPGDCLVRIHFQPRYDGTEDFALVRQVRSGREYSSGHPALQKLNPRVVTIWLTHRLQ